MYAVPGLEALTSAAVLTEENIYQAKEVNGTTYFPLNIRFQSNPAPPFFNTVELPRPVHHRHSGVPSSHPAELLATAVPQDRARLQSEVEQMLLTKSQNLPSIKRALGASYTYKVSPSDPRNYGAETRSLDHSLKIQVERAGRTRRFSIAANGYFNAMQGRSESSANNTQIKHRRQFSYAS